MGEAAVRRAPLDQETRIRDDAHDALRLWLRLLTCTSLIQSIIRTRLRESFECTLPRFDLMAQELEQWLIRLFSHVPDGDRKRLHGLLGELKSGLTIPRKR